jgi:DNA modification methylase
MLAQADALITDPPYGVDKAEWDSAYPEWIEEAALKAARSVCIMPGLWALPGCSMRLGDAYKGIIAGRNVNGMTFGPLGFNNWIPAVCAGETPRRGMDAFEFSIGAEPKPEHPSPKPLSYMLKLVARVTDVGWTVIDPFAGSGTTAVACALLDRAFTGIEIGEAYFDTACRRIEEAYRQPRLFSEPIPQPKQEELFDPVPSPSVGQVKPPGIDPAPAPRARR